MIIPQTTSLYEQKAISRRGLKRATPIITMTDSLQEEIYSRLILPTIPPQALTSSVQTIYSNIGHMLRQVNYYRRKAQ